MTGFTFSHLPDRVFTPASRCFPHPCAIVFGAGGRGAEAVRFLRALGVRVLAVADNDPAKHGLPFEGLPVAAPSSLAALGARGDVPVVVASLHEAEIAAQLAGMGLPGLNFFRPEEAAPVPDLIEANAEAVASAYSAMADEASRAVFLQALRLLTPKFDGRMRQSPYPQYDHPEVRAEPGDTVLDVGGMDGETALFFARRAAPGGRVFTFEPSPKHIARIRERLSVSSGPVELVELGAWSHPCELSFDADFPESAPGCHRVDPEGGQRIRVTDLDGFLEARGHGADFIKMDIEGAEMEALAGAARTLARFAPKLAISVYHRPEHLWEALAFIRQVQPRYTFRMGHHSPMGTETVLYARV